MTLAPRWRKLLGDLNAAPGRVMMMVAALAIGMFAVTTISSAYATLSREISRNYLDTQPASALIDVGAVTPEILTTIAAAPDIESAEPAAILTGQVKDSGGNWQRALVFVAPDVASSVISKVVRQDGQFPPPEGSVVLEREALAFLNLVSGGRLTLRLTGHEPVTLPVAGTAFDASLAPAWQEQTAYIYMSARTLAQIDDRLALDLVKVVVRDARFDQARTDSIVAALALKLQEQGATIHQIQIPPAGQHPHQGQMNGVLGMFLIFAILALVLSAVLTANMVSALLAQQVRQIAIMKAIGGTTIQMASLYLAGIAVIATIATTAALLLGFPAGAGFAAVIAELLNFDIAYSVPPLWLVAGLTLLGVLLPLFLVGIPVARATRVTVREALSNQGLSQAAVRSGPVDLLLARLPGVDRTLTLALRNAFRKRGRLILNLALLGAAGAMFIAALNVELAWQEQIATASGLRTYDLEVKFAQPEPMPRLIQAIGDVDDVIVRSADGVAAAIGRSDGLMIVRTYPDGGHGSLSLRPISGMPAEPLFMAGGPNASDLVLNQQAWSLAGRPTSGAPVLLAVEGRTFQVVLGAVIREILTPATAYISESRFALAAGRTDEVSALRLTSTSQGSRSNETLADQTASALAAAGMDVAQLTTEGTLAAAQAGHVKILITALLAMAIIMAAIGTIGLATSQGSSVTERIRELGIMRTIGASGGALIRNILVEGTMIALLSLPIATALGLPLGYAIGVLVGTMSFGLPLPITVSVPAIFLWTGLLVIGSVGASLPPARRATRLTIRQTLALN